MKRQRMSVPLVILVSAAILALLAAGCGAATTPVPSGGTAGPSALPTVGGPAQGGVVSSPMLLTIKQRGKLRVGLTTGFIPYEYSDPETGQPNGIDVELARMMAADLGVELEIQDVDWDGIIPGLQADKYDIIISAVVMRSARAQVISFSQPYVKAGQSILIRSDETRFQTVADFDKPGIVIAVQLGTVGDQTATQLFPNAEVRRFNKETEAVLELQTGRADAVMYETIYIKLFEEQNKWARAMFLDEPFASGYYAMAMRQGDPDFVNYVNVFLTTIQADGTLQRITDEYFAKAKIGS